VIVALVVVALGGFVLFLFFLLNHLRLWIQAHLTNTPVSFAEILGMRWRGTPPWVIVPALIELRGRGIPVSADALENQYQGARECGEPVATATELVRLVMAARSAPPPE
jgi:uncharacterized protein YqfA (UPF0365 family)